MKILMINGQNHKGTTYHTGRMIAEKLAVPENIEEIFLPRDFGEFCTGCNNCFMKSEKMCPHYKKIGAITEKIKNADILIFTTPTYVYHSTGQMKAFLDHYGWLWINHRMNEGMMKKQAVIVSTAAGMGTKSAIKDIADSCFFWGIPKVYKYGKSVFSVSWEKVTKKHKAEIKRDTAEIAEKIKSCKVPKVPLKTKAFFMLSRFMVKKGMFESDRPYWESKGWTADVRPWKQG